MNDIPVSPYAIEKNSEDGLFYLHTERVLAENGRDFISSKHLPGFSSDAAARAHARGLGAADRDIAPNPGLR